MEIRKELNTDIPACKAFSAGEKKGQKGKNERKRKKGQKEKNKESEQLNKDMPACKAFRVRKRTQKEKGMILLLFFPPFSLFSVCFSISFFFFFFVVLKKRKNVNYSKERKSFVFLSSLNLFSIDLFSKGKCPYGSQCRFRHISSLGSLDTLNLDVLHVRTKSKRKRRRKGREKEEKKGRNRTALEGTEFDTYFSFEFLIH